MPVRLLFIAFLVLVVSCGKPATEVKETPEGTYFSIIDYAKDQWSTYHGQPFGMLKTVYFNGIVDSVASNALELDWASIFKVFFETDISNPKFIGQYDFSAFNDHQTATNTFYYEAKNPKLYTRKLQIIADEVNNKIESIYIEAAKQDRMGTKTVKLFYTSLRSISIQELETSKTGQKKELRVVYKFL